jgi:hypothetical protein
MHAVFQLEARPQGVEYVLHGLARRWLRLRHSDNLSMRGGQFGRSG